jgi:ABC-type Fe2+-enterobactin transport system substrate-binding protein
MTTLAAIATATLIITAFAAVVAAVLTDRHEHRTDYEQFARDLDDAAERRRLRRLFETDQLPGGPTRDDVA